MDHRHGKWTIDIDGLPINSMVDLSMANWQTVSHNQMVTLAYFGY